MEKGAIAVIQARMSSTRLPGKVLMPLAGKPLLWHIVNRLRYCKELDEIIVATSTEARDDTIEQFCRENNITVYRGSLDDVLKRFLDVIDMQEALYVARITGDTPFVTPEFVDKQVRELKKHDGDLIVCDTRGVLFGGQGVFSSRALKKVAESSQDPRDREHVGSFYMKEHPEEFKAVSIEVPKLYAWQGRMLTIDTKDDYERIARMYKDLSSSEEPYIPLTKIIDWLNEHEKTN